MLWRGLSRRVVLVGAISTVLLTAGIGIAMIVAVTKQFVARAAHLVPPPPDDAMARCRAAPESWSYAYPRGGMEAWAFDAATLRAANPQAPELDERLVEQVRDGVETPALSTPGKTWAVASMLRLAPAGPCSLLLVRWPSPMDARLDVLGLLGGVALGGVALTLALMVLLVLRPMLLRLRRLEAAATGVGDAARYQPLGDPAADEIGSIARVLDRAHGRIVDDAARLEAGRRRLEQHLADVAHDLRTPLASLGLTLEELGQNSLDAGARELSGRALGDVVYLAALVENLHLATRLAGDERLPRGEAELGEIVERVRLRFALLGRERGVTVEAARPEVDVLVACEPATAERAVANLVHNAVAHGERGGHVALVLDRVDEGRGFRLRVLDDGPGVPPAELPRLGSGTFRSDPARGRDTKGTGLGLIITGEVCRRACWTLAFEAGDPRGLTVVIAGPTLPSPGAAT
ncbi:MAG: HAMP domain-containing sensor histidine kinase [Myxococcota bacterium]